MIYIDLHVTVRDSHYFLLVIIVVTAVKHNPHSGNLRALVKKFLELATNLRDESQCERLVDVTICMLVQVYTSEFKFIFDFPAFNIL